MNEESTNTQAKKPGTPTESSLRQKVVPYTDEILQKLLEHMRSRNQNASLGACNTLLKKVIPDLKALEITGENGEPIKFNIVAGADYTAYLSRLQQANATSGQGAYAGASTIQNSNLAQKSPQDNNSDNPISNVGTE